MNSFQIEQEILINAPAAKVFQRLVGDVAPWWDHGFSENPKAIVLEPKVGGRFYEEFGGAEGDGALYCTVMQVETGKKLVLQGPMGMRGAVFGNIAFELVEQGGATTLKLSHHAIGEVTEEDKKNYTSGWRELLGTRLKNFVETGKA